MTHKICDSCETVAHCMKAGCLPVQPQKPAFHGFMDKENCTVNLCFTPHAPGGPNNELPTAYYTSPPAQRKPWVGLTEDDWDDILNEAATFGAAIRVTEAKLREKNT